MPNSSSILSFNFLPFYIYVDSERHGLHILSLRTDITDITDLTDTTLLCIIHRKDGTLWQEEENHVF